MYCCIYSYVLLLKQLTLLLTVINHGYQSTLIKTWYSWWQIDWDRIKDGSCAGFFALGSGDGLGLARAHVGTHLRFISEDAAEYAAKTFKPLYMKHIFGID
jgi:hypothetical protein